LRGPDQCPTKKVLASISVATDPSKLRTLQKNALRLGVQEVEDAAFKRLIEVLPEVELHRFPSGPVGAIPAARGRALRLTDNGRFFSE
jgi:hypothetical protein